MDKPIQDKIIDRLRRYGRGTVFTPKDFLDLGSSRQCVDQALTRLAKAKVIQRVGRGLYSYPKVNKRLRISVPPNLADIADALARQTGSRIAPSGATAANQLGLSTQVPAKPVYLTDGRSRHVKVGNYQIAIKHVSPRELPAGSPTSATVVQALRYLGKDGVGPTVLGRIRKALSPRHRAQLLHDARYTTDWIGAAVRQIADQEAISHG